MRPSDIKQLRARWNLSQEALASVLGVHTQTVSKWERGKLFPSGDQLYGLNLMRRLVFVADVRDGR